MFERVRCWLRDRPIRYKLLAIYSSVFILVIAAGGAFTYSLVRTTVEKSIESELGNSTAAILNLVKTSAAASIRNYLRAVADRNLEIVQDFYERFRRGELSEREARQRAARVMLSQKIGTTGYICCLDSAGVMRIHPEETLVSVDLSAYAFVRELVSRKTGYLEYDWRNPGETAPRPKAMYMAYFAPWDLIIVASSYRDEFKELVNVEDFRESVLSMKFGKTGYSFIVDTRGNAIVHPQWQGGNVFRQGGVPTAFFAEMLRKKDGKILYSWRNPGDAAPRQKLVIYNHIPEYDWIVGSSSYLDELGAPLRSVRNVFVAAMLGSLLLLLPLTWRISSSITTPLKELMERFAVGAGGDFSPRMERRARDEVGQLAAYFNTFMERLADYSESLTSEIAERKQAQKALQLSEEMFSKAFQSSPDGICVLTLQDRRFLNVNDAFLLLTGYGRDEVLGSTPVDLGLFLERASARKVLREIETHGHLRGLEVAFRTRSGAQRLGRVSAEVIEIWDVPSVLATIQDVTEWRRLERELIETGDRERAKVGQELHDDLAPHLIGIEVLSAVLQRRLGTRPGPEVEHAEKIRGLIGEAIQKTRALARGLCPVHLADNGLEFALRELSANEHAIYGIPCELRTDGGVLVEDNLVATQLFSIAREAVHNAVKHAHASRIIVALAEQEGTVHLAVEDDGDGMDEASKGTGMGLRIMEYRARLIGARLSLRTRAGVGTIVSVTIASGGAAKGDG